MIELTFKAESLLDINALVLKAAAELENRKTLTTEEACQAVGALFEAADKKKKAKAKKTEPFVESLPTEVPLNSTPVAEAIEKFPEAKEEILSSYKATKEDVEKALRTLNEKKGLEAARKILQLFGWQRLPDVTADKYNDFLSACLAATNG